MKRSWLLLISLGLTLVLAVASLLIGCASGTSEAQTVTEPSVSAEPQEGWHAMVKKISLWQNGEEQVIDPLQNPKQYVQIGDLLTGTLHKLNLQTRCLLTEERIRDIKEHDKVIEMSFREAEDITIGQWIEPRDRDYIKTDENGYRILENVDSTLFILEDNLGGGLEAHILVGSGTEFWSCWAIRQEGSNELDKAWINEVAKILAKE